MVVFDFQLPLQSFIVIDFAVRKKAAKTNKNENQVKYEDVIFMFSNVAKTTDFFNFGVIFQLVKMPIL